MIETGSDAPDFDLKVDSSTRVRLSDFRGRRNVLLVFHPFAFTAVCEEEALDLQENLPAFESAETDVLLVSCDSAPSRQAWKEKLGLTYTLPSDFWPHGEAATRVRRLRREQGRARPRHVPDRQGRGRGLEPRQRRRHPAHRADLRPARRSGRVTLARYEWGDENLPLLVCLHGVTSHGRHFRPLAERLAERFHVVALDLRGHGDSIWEPPWNLEQHVADVLDAAPEEPLRLARSLLRRPRRLRGRGRRTGSRRTARPARSRDPASSVRRPVSAENARRDRSYASFEEGIDRRYEESVLTTAPRELVETELREHLVPDDEGRWRYRYCQSAVVAAYGEMTREQPAVHEVRIPTLLLLGETSYLPYDALLDDHAAALGDLLEVVRIPAGHTVLWDAFAETAGAIERFLG